ncbi:MAG: hypothetical protein JNM93_00235 [Bacteriovoracaceae bacterium]|nr:hypothetical protein [Bacteriovoracaceae bacterium]
MNVLLLMNDQNLKNELEKVISEMGITLHHGEPEGAQYIICDNAHFDKIGSAYVREKAEKFILLSSEPDEVNVLNYLGQFELNHIIGVNGNLVIQEVKSNLNKIHKKTIWGLKQYLEESAQVSTEGIEQSHQIHQTIDKTLAKFDFSEYFESPTEYLKVMSNELVTNALYNGVATRESLHIQEALSRKQNVFLKGSEHILFSVGKDTNSLAVSVQDTFGKLNRKKVVENLVRSFKEKTVQEKIGGAGLGLYMIYNHANQFILNYKRNKRTEVIAVIDLNKRFKKYRERITSFHFHEEV